MTPRTSYDVVALATTAYDAAGDAGSAGEPGDQFVEAGVGEAGMPKPASVDIGMVPITSNHRAR
jgi:hypothetical protein